MKLYSITVHGNEKTWSYMVWAKPEHVQDWRDDGIEVDEVLYTVPEIIQRIGLTKAWCVLQKTGLIPM